jgi:hypothetical protein
MRMAPPFEVYGLVGVVSYFLLEVSFELALDKIVEAIILVDLATSNLDFAWKIFSFDILSEGLL